MEDRVLLIVMETAKGTGCTSERRFAQAPETAGLQDLAQQCNYGLSVTTAKS